MSIHRWSFPQTIPEVTAASGLLSAGGTDLQSRINAGLLRGPVVMLRDVPGLQAIEIVDRSLVIGSLVSISQLAEWLSDTSPSWPAQELHLNGLREAALGLATPAIRRMATVGGNLFQELRCPYLRGGLDCNHTKGSGCHAKELSGHSFALLESETCAAVHPSTLAMALLAYDAQLLWANTKKQPLLEGLQQPAGQFCIAIHIPLVEERVGAWLRFSAREHAEWPQLEGVLTLRSDSARLALGSVGRWPELLVAESLAGLQTEAEHRFQNTRAAAVLKRRLLKPMISQLIARAEGA